MENKDTYRLWCIRNSIMRVSVLVRVASSDAWNDYIYVRIIKEHFLLSAYFLDTESDRRMCLLTGVYGMCIVQSIEHVKLMHEFAV